MSQGYNRFQNNTATFPFISKYSQTVSHVTYSQTVSHVTTTTPFHDQFHLYMYCTLRISNFSLFTSYNSRRRYCFQRGCLSVRVYSAESAKSRRHNNIATVGDPDTKFVRWVVGTKRQVEFRDRRLYDFTASTRGCLFR